MSLESLFKGSPNLPNIPKVVQELIKQFNDPHSNVDEISKKIQMDQVLSAKIMRLANSARYGAGRKIASIDSAVVMLGIDTLKTLVVASGITGAFQDIPGFDKKQFWRDSFMVASISKLIAKHTDSDPETAFTIGMMRNIGELLIHIYHEESAVKIDKLVESGANRIDLQDNQFGYDFTQAGSELAKRWNFPTEIVNGIRQQAAPNDFEEYSAYSSIVYLADYLNEAFKAEQEKQEILSQ
ncbi:signal transduction protein, partial [Oleiphilus sp. HI0043]|uniref:HDOD domain-containing protein n=3 Tax=Oleiphilus TaxID=141450 RepID=UPI0007C23243